MYFRFLTVSPPSAAKTPLILATHGSQGVTGRLFAGGAGGGREVEVEGDAADDDLVSNIFYFINVVSYPFLYFLRQSRKVLAVGRYWSGLVRSKEELLPSLAPSSSSSSSEKDSVS